MSGEVERRDALAKALCLLDTFAGEGLGHVYGNGQTIDADDACVELAEAFDVEFADGWFREVAALATRTPSDADRTAVVEECARAVRVVRAQIQALPAERNDRRNPITNQAALDYADWTCEKIETAIRRLSTPAGEDRP